ncbi:integral membrane sensor signal transduction histidine kinase [Methanococcus vannielii SB]|uniref:histidine kinase n=1 Tax=Methanococcus vannielii (strain ATCC 35089 / DSM 1224 / JCM 13029 / OCM 148 / SB) TaxID=406327 RepID=A6UPU7_METVS|nr:ATP-binding protein [Methanococcus vannielii]ABR54519.1 integral membrane sensor signal transduction histidine kinase [Methanococcus vannielii SB]
MKTIPPIKRLGTKLMMYSIIVALIPIVMLGAVSINTITNEMNNQAQDKINNDLKIAESILGLKLEKLSSLNTYVATSNCIMDSIVNTDYGSLKNLATATKISSEADFVVLLDKNGNVIARSNSNVTGDDSYSELFFKAVSYDDFSFIEILDLETLKYEDVEDIVQIEIKSDISNETLIKNRAMALVSIKPVYGTLGELLGASMAVDILNNDYEIVDIVRNSSGDATTIFLDSIRISTNVLDGDERAIGTPVSNDVYTKVVEEGGTYYGRAYVVNEWYFTAYEPIYDSDEKIIGILFVGTPENKYFTLLSNIRDQTFVVGLIGLLIALTVSLLLNRIIIKPLDELKHGVQWISGGDYTKKVNVTTDDEFGMLARVFNEMADQINSSNEKLKKHAEELKESYEELKELDNLKSDLIAIVSHELRTPLTSIKGYVELVLDGTMGTINESQRKCLQVADDNIIRLRRLIESMLDLSKIERGELEMYREAMNVKDTVSDVIEYLTPLATEKNIKLKQDIKDLLINADKDRITQVFTNLIENAIKFSPANESIMIIGKETENGDVHITVKDNGAGIPKKDLEKIFDQFYQVDSSTKRKKGGSGLGLAVCKSIIQAHGGTIWVESELGRGSTFHIVLPALIYEESIVE